MDSIESGFPSPSLPTLTLELAAPPTVLNHPHPDMTIWKGLNPTSRALGEEITTSCSGPSTVRRWLVWNIPKMTSMLRDNSFSLLTPDSSHLPSLSLANLSPSSLPWTGEIRTFLLLVEPELRAY